MLSRTTWAFARVEAAEVLLEVTQEAAGHPSGAALPAVPKGNGPCCLDDLGLYACRSSWSTSDLPKSQSAILLEQLSMQLSKEMGHAPQDDLGLCTC